MGDPRNLLRNELKKAKNRKKVKSCMLYIITSLLCSAWALQKHWFDDCKQMGGVCSSE